MIARFLFLLFSFVAVALAQENPERKPLIVGMELSYPPFEMTDVSGKPIGVSVDLAHALGKALDRPVEIRNIAYGGLIPALRTGKVDCVISSMTATPERARAIDFSDPYLKTGLAILAGKGSGVRGIDDLNAPSRTVAVKIDTTGHLYAARNLRRAKLLVLDKETRCVLEVTQKKADAFLYDQMSVYANWKQNPETTEPLLGAFQQESWAIGIRKGNDMLRKEINRFIETYRAEGGFKALGDRWLAEPKAEFEKRGIPFVF